MTRQLIEFMQAFRIADAIDIAIIATLIYLLLIWFEKARARFMLVGMIAVGLVYVAARLFGLYLTTLVFQAFFAISLIMVVIIFQDDFRRFFESVALLGMTKRGRRGVKGPFDQEIDIISSGVASLSRKRIGALIVIPGSVPLERYVEAGVDLDGALNEILIESIFDPHVPTHDGAVIVEEMKITKFGCHLPLSSNIQEIGRLGTRHAAALGLTEQSDALCIIVSEERGTVSIAELGRIRQLKDVADLTGLLKNFYQKKFPTRRRSTLPYFLKGHLMEKLAAVIIAFGLWFVFGHRTEVIRRDFVVPIEYRNLAADRIVEEPKPKEVNVTLSGSERAFNLLSAQDLKLSMDMSGIRDGGNKFILTRDLVRRPAGLSVVNMSPDEIHLTVNTMTQVIVPLEVKTRGRPGAGLVLREVRVEPKEIPVIASSAIRRDSIYVATESIDLSAITQTTTIPVKLVVWPDSIRFPNEKRPDVRVTISVDKEAPDPDAAASGNNNPR